MIGVCASDPCAASLRERRRRQHDIDRNRADVSGSDRECPVAPCAEAVDRAVLSGRAVERDRVGRQRNRIQIPVSWSGPELVSAAAVPRLRCRRSTLPLPACS